MTTPSLRDILEKLQSELEKIEVTDEAERERLRHLDADIRRLLDRPDDPPEADETMLDRFQESVDHFETSHPRLTMMISQIMTILSNAGI